VPDVASKEESGRSSRSRGHGGGLKGRLSGCEDRILGAGDRTPLSTAKALKSPGARRCDDGGLGRLPRTD
jgi:hypothetical protein